MSMDPNIRKALTKNVVDIAQSLVSLNVAGDVITADLTTLTKVGKGSILKVVVGGATYVAFTDDAGATITPSVTHSPGLLLATGTHYILCTCDYIKMDVNPTRKELIRT